MTDWIVDRTARTAPYGATGLILDVVRKHRGSAYMHARHETAQGLVATVVERLMVEGKAVYSATERPTYEKGRPKGRLHALRPANVS